jgi:hypothetical protein
VNGPGIDAATKRLTDLLWSRFVGNIGKLDRYLCDATPTARWSSDPLTEDVVADHILGRKRIGVGQIEMTLFGAIDFDGKTKDAEGRSVADPARAEEAWAATRLVADLLERQGFEVLVEVSRSRTGWHVWVLCDPVDPPTVDEMRRLLAGILRRANLPDDGNEGAGHPGVFPHPPGPKECGRTPFLPWSGLLNGKAGGLFVDVADGAPLDRQETVLEDPKLATREQILDALQVIDGASVERDATTAVRELIRPTLDLTVRDGEHAYPKVLQLAMKLRNHHPKEFAEHLVFAYAEKYGVIDRHGRDAVQRQIDGAYDKPPLYIMTEFDRERPIEAPTPLEPTSFKSVSNPGNLAVPWLIEGLIPAAGLTIIAAHYKTGKTFLMYKLILDALFGTLALGSFPVPRPLKVQLWQFEMPLDVNLRRFHKLAKGMDIDPMYIYKAEQDGQFQAFVQPDISLADVGGLASFHDAVTKFAPDLLVVDSLSEAFPGVDFNHSHEVRTMLRDAFRPVTVDGRGTVALHHKRKPPPGKTPDDGKGSILGSQAFGAASRTVYTLDRVRDDGPEAKGRYVVYLAPQGGWDLETSGSTFVIADNEAGTMTTVDAVRPKNGKPLKTVSEATQAAIKYAEIVRSRMRIGRQSAIEAVRLALKCGKTTAEEGLALAVERKWVEMVKSEGTKSNEKELRPGCNSDWDDPS